MFCISIFQYIKICACVVGLLLVCGSRLSARGWLAAWFAALGSRLAVGLRLGLRLAAGGWRLACGSVCGSRLAARGWLSVWLAARGSRLVSGLRFGLRLAACGSVCGLRFAARGCRLACGSVYVSSCKCIYTITIGNLKSKYRNNRGGSL